MYLHIGSTTTSFDILVTADNIPELDEAFNVVLLDVNEDNQEVADTQVQSCDSSCDLYYHFTDRLQLQLLLKRMTIPRERL